MRSPTAEQVFKDYANTETRSAGVARDAEYMVGLDDVDWAEIIFVMEVRHKRVLEKMFGEFLQGKRMVCLNIPDSYEYMDSELMKLLQEKIEPYLHP